MTCGRPLSSLFVITAIALTWHAVKEGEIDVYDLSAALVRVRKPKQ